MKMPRLIVGAGRRLFMKHGAAWWILIGWWWYLCFAWWVYPIKWFLSRKSSNAVSENQGRLLHEAEGHIINFLRNSSDGTALQVDVKRTLPGDLTPYFDQAKARAKKGGARIGTKNTGAGYTICRNLRPVFLSFPERRFHRTAGCGL